MRRDRPQRGPGRRRIAGAALAVCLAAVPALAQAPGRLPPAQRAEALASGRVAASVVERLDREASAPVIVVFRGAAAEAHGAPTRRFDPGVAADVRARGDAVLRRLAAGDLELRHRYRALHGMAGHVTPRGLAALLRDPEVVHVDEDTGGTGQLLQAIPLANIDLVHGLGFRGAGVTVAVLDSGVNAAHPDIGAAAVVGEQCFCSGGGGCCPAGGASQSGTGAAADDHGHGTNVTGIVTSDGGIAPEGAAPDAAIVAIKVLDSNNAFCCNSDVIAGLDWVLADRPDVDVVNMSLGTFATFTGECDGANATTMMYAEAIDALRAQGVVSVVSSGNARSTTHMSAPACIGNAVSVAAVWDASLGSQSFFGCTDNPTAADRLTCWSNRNATTDLVAPGAPTTSTGSGGGTSTFIGTSQAAPLVAACAALLLESDPSLAGGQAEAALTSSPTWITDPVTGLGYPRLDCAHALAVAGAQAVPLPAWTIPALIVLLGGSLAYRRLPRPRGPGGDPA
jgi:subtilisin family serine protease